MFAYIFPFFGIFWSMFYLYIWVMLLILLFKVFADIFRSTDLGGLAKAGWLLFVIVVPFVGILVYVIARGDSMATR